MKTGSLVTLTLLLGAEKTPTDVPAIVLSSSPSAVEGESPALKLAYLNPKRLDVIGTPDWRNAFDQVFAKHNAHDDVANSAESAFWTEITADAALGNEVAPKESVNEIAARLAHEANRAYCISIGDNSQPAWKDAPEWQRTSAINGVTFHFTELAAGVRPSPSQSHEAWLKEKADAGWKFGPTKDVEKKEHPCFVPYDELPAEQRIKDVIFGSVVEAVFSSNIEIAQSVASGS